MDWRSHESKDQRQDSRTHELEVTWKHKTKIDWRYGEQEAGTTADILVGNTVWGGKMRIYWMETQRRKELLISWSEKIGDILNGDTETERITNILVGENY